MSKYITRAMALRAIVTPHYNCGQAVILPFTEEMGLPSELVMRFSANFGGGMKTGALCGAIAGGVTVLALHGLDDPQSTQAYYARIREKYPECLDCRPLLALNTERGNDKKAFCNGLVSDCIAVAEELLREAGKIE